MTEEPQTITITEYSTEGVEPEFHIIIKKYGRSLFATMINAGQANAATAVLNTMVGRLQNEGGRDALAGLIQAFNQLNVAYMTEKGWTEEYMQDCNKEIQAVMQTKIITAPTLLGPDGMPLKH